jgi:hypothetical protein
MIVLDPGSSGLAALWRPLLHGSSAIMPLYDQGLGELGGRPFRNPLYIMCIIECGAAPGD